MAGVSIDGMAQEITKAVELEITEVRKATRTAVRKSGQVVVDELHQYSPVTPGASGAYAAGWTQTVEGNDLVGYRTTVHNPKLPGLPHLVELGHGGPMPAGPHPHIAPAAEKGFAQFEKEFGGAVG